MSPDTRLPGQPLEYIVITHILLQLLTRAHPILINKSTYAEICSIYLVSVVKLAIYGSQNAFLGMWGALIWKGLCPFFAVIKPNCLFTRLYNFALSQMGFVKLSFCRNCRFMKPLLCCTTLIHQCFIIYSFLQNQGCQRPLPL